MAEIVTKERVPYRIWDKVNNKWNELKFKTNANSVDANDGDNMETKVGAIKGITTSTEVTEEGYAADATVVAALNSNLGGYALTTIDGKIAYYKESEGADSAVPFSSGKGSFDYITVEDDDNVYELIVESPINGTAYFMGSGASAWGVSYFAYVNDTQVAKGNTQGGAIEGRINHSENVQVGDIVKLKFQVHLKVTDGYGSYGYGLIGIK